MSKNGANALSSENNTRSFPGHWEKVLKFQEFFRNSRSKEHHELYTVRTLCNDDGDANNDQKEQ